MARLFSLRTLAFTSLCAFSLTSCSWVNGISNWANETMPTYDGMTGQKPSAQPQTMQQQPRRTANDAYGTAPTSAYGQPPAQPAYDPNQAYGQPPQTGGAPSGYPSNIPSAPPGYGDAEPFPGGPVQVPQYGGGAPSMPAAPPWPGR